MATRNRRFSLPAWTVASTVGLIGGVGLAIATFTLVEELVGSSNPWALMNLLATGAVIGASLGVAQWIVLAPRAPLRRWIPINAIGAAAGTLLATVLLTLGLAFGGGLLVGAIYSVGGFGMSRPSGDPYSLPEVVAMGVVWAVIGASFAAGLAVGQWAVLRRRGLRLRPWLTVSVLGLGGGLVVGAGVRGVVWDHAIPPGYVAAPHPRWLVVSTVVGVAITGTVFGGLTGRTLRRLTRRSDSG